MKLQEGDYIANLTEKQWNELLDIENNNYKQTYDPHDIDSPLYFKNGLMLEGGMLHHTEKDNCKQELTFRQFKSRAKNTFNP